MTILTQYWIKSFLRFFIIIQLIVMLIFISVDYLTNIDKFLKSDLSLISAFGYVLLKTPFMFVQLTPAGTVLAVVTVFGLMNKSNELLAIKAGGISPYRIVLPAVSTGIALALLMFFLGETIVPLTMSKANHIKYFIIKKKSNVHAIRENIWIKGNDNISHFKYFNPIDKTISGITIAFMDKNFRIIRRVDAKNGKYSNIENIEKKQSIYNSNSKTITKSDINHELIENGQSKSYKWIFTGVLEQTFDKKIQDFVIKEYEQKEIYLDFDPDVLKEIVKKAEEMTFIELTNHIKKIQNEGYDATSYKVDLFGKTAFPFICVIMATIGSATGMRRFVKENIAFGIAIGIGASFFYWIVYGFSTSLGYARVLPPFVSAWATNLLFLFASVIYLLNTE